MFDRVKTFIKLEMEDGQITSQDGFNYPTQLFIVQS